MINQDHKTVILNGTIIMPFQYLQDRIMMIEKGKIVN